jgi:uncharacterized protein YdhG (YjbR/CyaY superfamily)
MAAPTTIDAYLSSLPDDARTIVRDVCEAVRRGIPGAEEKVRYGMPAFMYPGAGSRYALHVGGWKHHVGIYPVGELPAALEVEVEPFRSKKDSVTFKYNVPMPLDLIERIAAALADKHR